MTGHPAVAAVTELTGGSATAIHSDGLVSPRSLQLSDAQVQHAKF